MIQVLKYLNTNKILQCLLINSQKSMQNTPKNTDIYFKTPCFWSFTYSLIPVVQIKTYISTLAINSHVIFTTHNLQNSPSHNPLISFPFFNVNNSIPKFLFSLDKTFPHSFQSSCTISYTRPPLASHLSDKSSRIVWCKIKQPVPSRSSTNITISTSKLTRQLEGGDATSTKRIILNYAFKAFKCNYLNRFKFKPFPLLSRNGCPSRRAQPRRCG